MNTGWNIEYSQVGNLIIEAIDDNKVIDLFGAKSYSTHIAIESHYIYQLKECLERSYPERKLADRKDLLELLNSEFFVKHSMMDFKIYLESEGLPFRFYNIAA